MGSEKEVDKAPSFGCGWPLECNVVIGPSDWPIFQLKASMALERSHVKGRDFRLEIET